MYYIQLLESFGVDFVGRHSTLKTNDSTMAEDNQHLESHSTNSAVSEVTLTNTGTPLFPLLLSKIGKIVLKNETSSALRKKAYSCRGRYRRRSRASHTTSSASEEASEDVKKMDYPPLSNDDMGVIQR